jgi:hypothetical protein
MDIARGPALKARPRRRGAMSATTAARKCHGAKEGTEPAACIASAVLL